MNTLFKTVTDRFASNESDNNVVALQQPETIEQTIFIRNLELEMFIGVMDSEKQAKQRVIVDAEISVMPMGENSQSDDINNVVSYADIIDQIKDLSQNEHINLVETFADMIIQQCFTHSSVLTVSVSVEKPDIMGDGVSVGATLTKSRF